MIWDEASRAASKADGIPPMFPVDNDAPRPAVPHSERIFAASKDLHDAYARGEEWTKVMPLHEAYVIFFLETVSDAIGALCDRWNAAGRPGHFPDSIAVQEELKRIICLEDNQARGAAEPEADTP